MVMDHLVSGFSPREVLANLSGHSSDFQIFLTLIVFAIMLLPCESGFFSAWLKSIPFSTLERLLQQFFYVENLTEWTTSIYTKKLMLHLFTHFLL